jgi:hypothetical protein
METLVEKIYDAIRTDGYSLDKRSDRIIREYKASDDVDKVKINYFLITLCGYSLEHFIEEYEEDKLNLKGKE